MNPLLATLSDPVWQIGGGSSSWQRWRWFLRCAAPRFTSRRSTNGS